LGGSDAIARSAGERPVAIDPTVVFPGTVSADGRFLPYNDRATGNVVVRDLTTGTDRVLSKGTRSEAQGFLAISRDGKQVAFERYLNSPREVELRIVSVQGGGIPEVRRLLALSYDNAATLSPYDWSPDGRWLAVRVIRPDSTTQLALVSVRDGTLRLLKSIEWQGPRNIFFSPDGRYIAYSLPIAGTRNESHVFVMAIDGSREIAVVDHPSENLIMGWSPDGESLLFASDRNGSFGLWTLPVSDGQSQATPMLVSTDILGANPVSLGVTASGALYVWKFTSNMYIHVAPIDLTIGKLLPDPAGTFRVFVGTGGKPTWSPDGKYLAYRSCSLRCSRTETIKIRTVDTDQVRELPMRLAYLQSPADLAWSSDGRSLIVFGTDLKGRRGNYLIDAQTGETSPDSSGLGPNVMTNVTIDGTKLYVAVGGSIVERERSSGNEQIVFQERAAGNSVLVNSSHDRRYTAFIDTASTRMSTLFVMPYGGGQPRELLRATALDGFGRNGMTWTLDSRAILLMRANGPGKELWLVPVTDGAARKLDIDVNNWQVSNQSGGFTLRPNGRQIAFVAGEDKEEVWTLANFLPAPSAKK
jgi:Tol biopolymer transport system component